MDETVNICYRLNAHGRQSAGASHDIYILDDRLRNLDRNVRNNILVFSELVIITQNNTENYDADPRGQPMPRFCSDRKPFTSGPAGGVIDVGSGILTHSARRPEGGLI
ncbi:hypothetical protein EVAR_10055_1 [Eumeta japonica]|uniref:Uncharacterized protein n=1 Tax=Eumeta variegata TaxID=151549 RepID=A0A4C1TR63_EUMVA|nr:hypothetical protein EVAR_10055_1 [Eumeta japonica]